MEKHWLKGMVDELADGMETETEYSRNCAGSISGF